VPGPEGSRVAAPARDFDQRSSDDNVPLPSAWAIARIAARLA
jgi:hypothetical protein